LAYKVGDVFLQVTTNAAKALEDLRRTIDVIGEERSVLSDAADAAERLNEALEDGSKSAVAQMKRQLRDLLRSIDLKDVELETIKKLHDHKSKWLEDEIKAEKKKARQVEIMLTEAMRREAAYTDYAGTLAEQRARAGEKVQKSELRNLDGFLSRAMSSHSRFADRLDRRDITRNVVENIRRGVEKGLLISERWHNDENALQRLARGFGIAGTAFQRVRSYSERAADSFYRFQRIVYLLQTAISTILGSIGALVGGLMGLVGVAGAAASSLVAVGSAMLSVVSGFVAARIGFGRIGTAVGQAWQQQTGYNRSLQEARRQLRALRFDAEEAALSEKEAALNLERAREELARVQDLPPDSRVRREVELQFQQAELAYRRAKARNAEVRADLARGNADPMSLAGGGGAQDPFAGLTKSQEKFAKYLVTLRPVFTRFRESVASQFLGPLEGAFRTIITKVFPTLETGMAKVGGAMGRGAGIFADALADPKNLELLSKFFTNSVPVIEKFADAMGSAFGGLLAVLEAAAPLTERFTSWVVDSAQRFEDWAKAGLNNGSLTAFYNLAGNVAASLGDVFGKVFAGINNIIDATFPGGDVTKGAGGVILRWLNGIASGFEAFTSSSGFSVWLEQTTTTATIAISTIGDFLGIMLDIANEPGLQQFWEILRQAVDPVESMLRDGAQAAPAFARLLVAVAEIFAVFSDSGALTIFMDTLAGIIEILSGIVTAIEPVITFFGRLHAAILAFTAVKVLFNGLGIVFFGIFEKMAATLGGFSRAIFKGSADVVVMRSRFDQLQKTTFVNTMGMSKMQASLARAQSTMANLGTSIWGVARAQAAAKNQQFLLAMAQAAKATDAQLSALNLELEKAIRNGNTTVQSMSRAAAASAKASGNAAALGAMGAAGIGSGSRLLGGARLSAGAAGGIGVASSIAGMFGSSMGSAAAQISGAIGMFGSMIPGLPGLIIGALGGLGSLIITAVEGANLQAKAAVEAKIAKMEVNNMTAQEIIDYTDRVQGVVSTYVGAGFDPFTAGAIQAMQDTVAASIASTKAISLGNVQAVIQELVSTGGAEILKTLSDPTTQAAQDLINSAVNQAIAESEGGQLTAETIARAVSTALSANEAGNTIPLYTIVPGTAGVNPVQDPNSATAKAYEAAVAANEAAAAAYRAAAPSPITSIPGRINPGGIDFSRFGTTAKPLITETKIPAPVQIDPSKNNTIKVDGADWIKTNAFLSRTAIAVEGINKQPTGNTYYITVKDAATAKQVTDWLKAGG
jgi:hypothetical protein